MFVKWWKGNIRILDFLFRNKPNFKWIYVELREYISIIKLLGGQVNYICMCICMYKCVYIHARHFFKFTFLLSKIWYAWSSHVKNIWKSFQGKYQSWDQKSLPFQSYIIDLHMGKFPNLNPNSWDVCLPLPWVVLRSLNTSSAETVIFHQHQINMLLMIWLPELPNHQHSWYWLCRINYPLSSTRKDFNNLCHLSVNKQLKMQVYLYVSLILFSK